MQTHNLKQGTAEWHAHRAKQYNASEAAAMMSASPWMTRDELLFEKSTGIAKEVDANLQRVFDRGHEVERLARPIIEEYVGQELYPTTGTLEVEGLPLGASFDGITLDDSIIWECKQWNKADAALLDETNELEPKHYWQVEQQLLISGADRCLFTITDGTKDGTVSLWYESKPKRRKLLIRGWKEFHADLQEYTPPATAALKEVTAHEPVQLPAVDVRVESSIIATNFDVFAERATAFLDSITTELETDQDFADAEANVKACKRAESELDGAVARILSSSEDVNQLINNISALKDKLKSTRLTLDKAVKSEKDLRKSAILNAAKGELIEFCDRLENDLHGARIPVEFNAQVIKGLSSLASIQNKVDAELRLCKHEAREYAERVASNWEAIPQSQIQLFRDWCDICDKSVEDFQNLVNVRLQAETDRLEAIKQREAEQAAQDAEKSVEDAPPPAKTEKTPQIATESVSEKLSFELWWCDVGSEMAPAPGEDSEEHMRRVARAAWRAATS